MKRILVLILFLCISYANFSVQGKITGLSGKHPIIVNIYNEQFWKDRKSYIQKVILPKQIEKVFEFLLPSDNYGLIVIEDKDNNGKMSFGLLGPSEPAKVYNLDKIVFGPPNFNDFKFSVTSDMKDVVINF